MFERPAEFQIDSEWQCVKNSIFVLTLQQIQTYSDVLYLSFDILSIYLSL